jgi:hypothetical protein
LVNEAGSHPPRRKPARIRLGELQGSGAHIGFRLGETLSFQSSRAPTPSRFEVEVLLLPFNHLGKPPCEGDHQCDS